MLKVLLCGAIGYVMYAAVTGGGIGDQTASTYHGGKVASASEIRGLLQDAGFPSRDVPKLTAIALAESGGRVGIVSKPNKNGTRDRCLMQVNDTHGYDRYRLTHDVRYCMEAAKEVYDRQGITAWSTYNNGAYLAHM